MTPRIDIPTFDRLCWVVSARCRKTDIADPVEGPLAVTADEPLRVSAANYWMSTHITVTVFHKGVPVVAEVSVPNHFEPMWLSTWLVRHSDDEFHAMVARLKSVACKAEVPGLWPALSQHVDSTDTAVMVCAVAHSVLVFCASNPRLFGQPAAL